MTVKIALDLENVIADVHTLTRQKSDILTDEDFKCWEFRSDDVFDHFLEITNEIWEEEWEDIEPTESCVESSSFVLSDMSRLDIVTNRNTAEDNIREWLRTNWVFYEDLSTGHHGRRKSEMDYDIYIDDNPNMAGRDLGILYLYDQPWNQHIRGGSGYFYHSYETCYLQSEGLPETIGYPEVIRVTSLSDVVYDLVANRGLEEGDDLF